MNRTDFELLPVGRVESPLTDPATAPKQGHEGAPDAWLHEVEIAAVDGPRVRVRDLEAVDGTPVIDVKPVLDCD
jgi:tRNA (Thr-GGU) A37 N-methylase